MAEPDDAGLAALAAAGDRSALEMLLDRHVDHVHAVSRRIVLHPEDALDATQDALLAIARKISRYDGRAAFTTWMYGIATQAATDELRRRHRPAPVDDLPEPAAPRRGIEDPVDARLDVDAALARLPAQFRVAVVLRDLCDLGDAEIAAVLEVPPGTVRSRIARGRASLVEHLGNPTPGPGRPGEGP